MLLSLIVTGLVLGVTAVFALAGWLIDLSARRNEKEQGN